MKRAAIYVRVSTQDLQTNDRQWEDLEIVAKADGYSEDNIEIYADKISGFVKGDDRPEFSKLIRIIRNDPDYFGCIYVHEISRLGRNPDHISMMIAEISNARVPIYILNLNQYTLVHGERNTFTNIVVKIMSEIAHQEVETLKMRFKSGLRSGVKKGRVGGGLTQSYGYRNDNQMLVVDEEEALIVKDIFDKYAAGQSSKEIADYLNKNNVPTRSNKAFGDKEFVYTKTNTKKNAKDIKWSGVQIITMLTNTIYKGERRFKDEIFPIQGIISKEQFDECTRIRTSKTDRDYNLEYDYLLRGLLKCGVCGRNFYGKYNRKHGGDKLYVCSSRVPTGQRCANVGINISYIESVVYDVLIGSGALAKRIQNKDSIMISTKADIEKYKSNLAQLNSEVIEAEEAKKRIQNLYFKGRLTDAEVEENLSENEIEIEELMKKIKFQESNLQSSNKLLKKLQSNLASSEFFTKLKDERKQVIKIFKEFVNEIRITKMTTKYVYVEIFLSIDGKKFDDSIKVFLDMAVPRFKTVNMYYDLAMEMLDTNPRQILHHRKKDSIADIFNSHPTVGYDEVFKDKLKIPSTQRMFIEPDNIFKLPIEKVQVSTLDK